MCSMLICFSVICRGTPVPVTVDSLQCPKIFYAKNQNFVSLAVSEKAFRTFKHLNWGKKNLAFFCCDVPLTEYFTTQNYQLTNKGYDTDLIFLNICRKKYVMTHQNLHAVLSSTTPAWSKPCTAKSENRSRIQNSMCPSHSTTANRTGHEAF